MKTFTPSEPPPCDGVTSGAAWKPVVGYEVLYEVSDFGAVRCVTTKGCYKGRTLKHCVTPQGYLRATLTKDGMPKRYPVHRLIANAFIPRVDGKDEIDHINTDRLDNRLENLRWCTHKENQNNPISAKRRAESLRKYRHSEKGMNDLKHANDCAAKVLSKPVICVETGIVYPSAKEAARQTGIPKGTIAVSLYRASKINHQTEWHGKNVLHFEHYERNIA